MIGSVAQIEWAEKIRNRLAAQWKQAIDNLVSAGISDEFEDILTDIYILACSQESAKVWIENQSGPMYSIADKGKIIGSTRELFNWSVEYENIMRKKLDKILEYNV